MDIASLIKKHCCYKLIMDFLPDGQDGSGEGSLKEDSTGRTFLSETVVGRARPVPMVGEIVTCEMPLDMK